MQLRNEKWEPIAFLSLKLNDSQRKWSTYDRELYAIYICVRRFQHILEGRIFSIFTDQKPLIYAFSQKADKCTPRQLRYLDYISQFSTDIRHVKGMDNTVADALSRIEIDSVSLDKIDFAKFAKAQKDDPELQDFLERSNTGLNLKLLPSPISASELYCDVSTNVPRPFVPQPFRRTIFQNFHCLSHPGISPTVKLISSRYVWPNMKKDIRLWTKTCLSCQKSKINRHTRSHLGTFALPDARFAHVHIDIIGPLKPTDGFIYGLTAIDRFTRWPEVFPMSDITAETVCKTFYSGWISRYGCPVTVTTDQGKQFESSLFKQFSSLLGSTRIRCTAYHPQANGIIERFHRHLKSSIMACAGNKWTDVLPTVLLGIRSAYKSDIQAAPSELVYGSVLRLPADLFDSSYTAEKTADFNFVQQLRTMMLRVKPMATSAHGHFALFVHPDLSRSTHVFLRCDRTTPPLTPPYSGPYKVLHRTNKLLTLEIHGRSTTVSIDRVKPAYILPDLSSSHPVDEDNRRTVTLRSGKRVHFTV